MVSNKVEFLKGNFQRSCKSFARFSNENHVIKIRVRLLHVKMLFLYIHAQVATEFFLSISNFFLLQSKADTQWYIPNITILTYFKVETED